jgi:gamma-butyrobetaine dioxygenase
MYEFRLRPGDTVVFNNRRMLHGRSHFQSKTATSNRVLNGCYVNVDEFWSRYRYLCVAHGRTPLETSVGNQAN